MKPIASIEKIMTTTMKLTAGENLFSGFYVKFKNTFAIMTAKHCTDGWDPKIDPLIDEATPSKPIKVKRVHEHPTRDLSLIELEESLPYQPLAYNMVNRVPKILEEVVVIGYPNGREGDSIEGTRFPSPIARVGNVAARINVTTIVVSANVYPGDSGGLVIGIDEKDQVYVVGVISAFWNTFFNRNRRIKDNMQICDVEQCWDFIANLEKSV